MPLPSLPLSVGTSESATQPTSTTPTRLLEVFKPIFADLHSMFFSKQFHPVAPSGQRMIPIPEGLDLESWIDERAQAVEVMNDDIEEELIHMDDGHGVEKEFSKRSSKKKGKGRKKHRSKSNKENDDVDDLEAEQRRKERQERLKNDPFYIQDTSTSASESLTALESLAPDIVDRSEIVESKEEPLVIPMKRRSKKSKPSKAPYSIASSKPPTPLNRSVGLLPENAVPMTSSHFMNADESATSVLQRSHSGYVDTSIDNDENRLKSVDLTVEQSVQERSNLRPYNEILKEKKTGKSKTAEKPKIKSKDRGRKKKSKPDVSGSVLEQEQKRILLLRTVDENIQAV
ncbi:hypothetical protein BKA69DRAFT_790663 [Paraphysoderma sedebokerense]|nr:hypothetical protein BKA69DRAFT_790663 [Paraphysoderma sedebokerense]